MLCVLFRNELFALNRVFKFQELGCNDWLSDSDNNLGPSDCVIVGESIIELLQALNNGHLEVCMTSWQIFHTFCREYMNLAFT